MALVLSNDYITAGELTGYVREALADRPENQFTLANFLPNTMVDDIDFRADVGRGGLNRAASFRAYDTEAPISSRRGIERITGELPPISEKRVLGEYDRLKMRQLPNSIRNAILDDGVELARAIETRLEIARGQALMDGVVKIEENGLGIEVNFGRNPAHTTQVGTFWATGGDPIEDLLAAQATYRATNGFKPGQMATSDTVVSTLMRNQKIREYTLPAGSTQQIVTMDAIQALLQSFRLPPLVVYEAQVEGSDGTPSEILDPTRVLFLPPANAKLGETQWGVTAEALDEDYSIDATEAPGIVVGSYSETDPVSRWTKASAIAFPIVPNTDMTFSLKVLG